MLAVRLGEQRAVQGRVRYERTDGRGAGGRGLRRRTTVRLLQDVGGADRPGRQDHARRRTRHLRHRVAGPALRLQSRLRVSCSAPAHGRILAVHAEVRPGRPRLVADALGIRSAGRIQNIDPSAVAVRLFQC